MEMCYDYVHLCDYHSISERRKHIHCGYLPSFNEEFPCFYEPITCGRPPPRVKHARLLTDVRHVRDYFLPAMVEYSCDEGFKMKGNKTIGCTSDGHWSTPPQCSPKSVTTTYQTKTKTEQRTTSEGELIALTTNQPITNTELTVVSEEEFIGVTKTGIKNQTAAAQEEFVADSTTASKKTSMIEFNSNSKSLTTAHNTEARREQSITSEAEFIALTTNQTVTNTAQTAETEEEVTGKSPAASTKRSMIEFNTNSRTNLMINLLVVALMLVLLLVALFIILAVRYKLKLKRAKKLGLKRREILLDIELKERDVSLPLEGTKDPEAPLPMPRKRTFDATIFYHFDSDNDFVLEHLLPELEEVRDFKLCFHSRNFTPGRDIKDNIEEAIEGSNSTIIVISQGFVDSIWCKEEFTHCYIENMKDAAFNLSS